MDPRLKTDLLVWAGLWTSRVEAARREVCPRGAGQEMARRAFGLRGGLKRSLKERPPSSTFLALQLGPGGGRLTAGGSCSRPPCP